MTTKRKTVRIWQIGPDGTEYYAAHSEQEMRRYYKKLIGNTGDADGDLRDHFEEVPPEDFDTPFKFDMDGKIEMVTWRKLIAQCGEIPTQISTGYL